MPIKKRNPDGSLSYTQTPDEKLQLESQATVKSLNRAVKKLTERVERLEAKYEGIMAEVKELKGTNVAPTTTDKPVVHAIL